MPDIAIKYCGIKTESDALAAIAAAANALGFNGFTGSKRYLDLSEAADWIGGLPSFAVRVAVLVNPTEDDVLEIMALGCFDRLQLHGDESPSYCATLQDEGIHLIKALPLADEGHLEIIADYPVRDILLDAHAPGVYGGTGQVIDWSLARRAVELYPERRIILSGGLHPGNVREATKMVQPYAVDVASGIESTPGQKDPAKMRAFSNSLRLL